MALGHVCKAENAISVGNDSGDEAKEKVALPPFADEFRFTEERLSLLVFIYLLWRLG